jgi:hypothetical protein
VTAADGDNDKAPDNDAKEIGDSMLVDNAVPSEDTDRDTRAVTDADVSPLADTLVDSHIVLVALVDVLSDGDDDIVAESDGEVVALSDMDTDADADADTLGDAELDNEPSPDSLGPPDALAASVGATVMLVRCVPLMES